MLISIHALLAESDSAPRITPTASRNFYPRSPCGERQRLWTILYSCPDFYPRSPCGERRIKPIFGEIDTNFYPRSPCGERLNEDRYGQQYWRFLSTLSLRRATFIRVDKTQSAPNFYPRSPCGERRMRRCTVAGSCRFLSTLSLRRATFPGAYLVRNAKFLSTLSLRRATQQAITAEQTARISIHALLAESDVQRGPWPHQRGHFYPRSPCGERPIFQHAIVKHFGFLSTLSLRRATAGRGHVTGGQ